MLAEKFQKTITDLGMEQLEHPLFYHAPVGIRFEIGGEEPIYLDKSAAKLKTNPAYVQGGAGPGRRDLSGTSGGAGPSADRRVSR